MTGWLEKIQAVKDRWDSWGRASAERRRQEQQNNIALERQRLANKQVAKNLNKKDYTVYYVVFGSLVFVSLVFALRR